MHVNYLGVDSRFFDGRRGQFDPASIVFIGRLVRQKGVYNLLEALRLLRENGVAANLSMIGEGVESVFITTNRKGAKPSGSFSGQEDPWGNT